MHLSSVWRLGFVAILGLGSGGCGDDGGSGSSSASGASSTALPDGWQARNAGIRQAQMRMIQEVPNCFTGPDYDTLAPGDRYDGIHLSEQGCWVAAQKWADALNASFFSSSTPYLPVFP